MRISFDSIRIPIIIWLALLPVFTLAENYGEILPDSQYSIIGLWHLNENSSSQTDSSGNGNTGTIVGATYITSGVFGGAYDFDGNGDEITFASNLFQVGTQATWTFAFWVSTTWYGDENSLWYHTGIEGSSIWGNQTGWEGTYQCGESQQYQTGSVTSTTNINDGGWHFVVCTKESFTSRKIYVDGNLEDTDTTSLPTDGTIDGEFYVARGWANPTYEWDGEIEEICVWDRALSATEIRQIYHMQKGAYGVH